MNSLQSLLHDSLIATGHVESCTLFRRDGLVKANSIGYEVHYLSFYSYIILVASILFNNNSPKVHAIYGLCIRIWSMQPSTDQAESLIEAFHNPTSTREHGIHFNGATYKCVRADKDSIYAKKVNYSILVMLVLRVRHATTVINY